MGKHGKYVKHYKDEREKIPISKNWLTRTSDLEDLANSGKGEVFCKLCRTPLHVQETDLKKHLNPKRTQSKENAALCDEVAKIQENIQIVKDERKFLLRKLLEYENDSDILQTFYTSEQIVASNGSRAKPKKRRSLEDGGKNIPT